MVKFLSDRGSTLVQILVAGTVLLGAGAFVMRSTNNQGKALKMSQNRDEAFHQINQVSDFLTDYENCARTFNRPGALDGAMTAILSKSGAIAYATGMQLHAGTIVSFNVSGYSPLSGMKYRELVLRIKFQFREARVNDQGSFGALDKVYEVPIYMITQDSTVMTCMSNQSAAIQDAMRQSCTEFGGNFNEVTGRCDDIHGTNGVVLNFTRANFCASGPACPHPNAGVACSGVDNRGVDHGNWVISGFDGSGQVQCSCMKITCPNPGLYCLNRDLGTDWCYRDCPRGSWDPQDWSPDPASQCEGVTFTQRNYCGRTRSETGTYDPGDYGPDPSTICAGTSYTMTNSCGKTQPGTGTKPCP